MNMRKAKVTEENLAEAMALRQLWDKRADMSQAEFGEVFNIGNQSAVGQFLNGMTPLSLKAAAGFAKGLSCKIVEFSPRLADQAAEFAMLSGLDLAPKNITDLSREEIEVVLSFRQLKIEDQQRLKGIALQMLNSGKEKQLSTTP